MPDLKDWRRRGQERYLKGVRLVLREYKAYREGWDHDHCEFCGKKFSASPEVKGLEKGYATEDLYWWVCEPCFKDFKEEFQW